MDVRNRCARSPLNEAYLESSEMYHYNKGPSMSANDDIHKCDITQYLMPCADGKRVNEEINFICLATVGFS